MSAEAEEVPEEFSETVDGVGPQEEAGAVEIREAAVVAEEGVVVVAEVEEEVTNEIKRKLKKLIILIHPANLYELPKNERYMCSE